MNMLELAAGLPYLTEPSQAYPAAASIAYYAKIVDDKATLRNVIQTASRIVTKGFEQMKMFNRLSIKQRKAF